MSTNVEHVQDEVEEEEAAVMYCMQAFTACTLPHAMTNAVQLGVPGILVKAGRGKTLTPIQIAEQIVVPEGAPKADPGNLERILRLLASYKLLKETLVEKDGKMERRFGASCATKYFIDAEEMSDKVEGSFVGMMQLSQTFHNIYPSVYKSVLDPSKEAQVHVHGKPLWEYFVMNPKEGDHFKKSFAKQSAMIIPLIVAKYDGFKTAKTLVDVGGGTGVNIAGVVAKYPQIRGINFDLPSVVKDAPKFPGVEHVGGSFLEKIPDCDTAYLKAVLHDWNDEICTNILKTIHKALPEDGKLIVVDIVLPEQSDDSLKNRVKLSMNYTMMALCTGGRERTFSEFQRLGATAGFHRVIAKLDVSRFTVLEFYKK